MEIVISIFRDYLIFINMILAGVIIFLERRRPVYTLFWITILLLTSYFGFIVYLFFGLSFKKKRRLQKFYSRKLLKRARSILITEYGYIIRWKELIRYLDSVTDNEMSLNNELKIFTLGENFFESLIRDLENAKSDINMEYYIFNDDELGGKIYNILLNKVKEGIKIRIIIDGAGTRGISKEKIKELREAGIQLEIFFPSYFPYLKIGNLRANYRDHRKICIIDKAICYTGGFNIGDEYIGKGKLGFWRDTGFKIKGHAVLEFYKEFVISWAFVKKEKHLDLDKEIDMAKKDISKVESIVPIQVVSSGPNYEFKNIRDTILKMILEAKKYVYIQTPYFIPDDATLEALKIAIMSGIDVRIMIPSVPDHMFVYWANQSFYGEVIDLGAKIYKYENGFLHSKAVIIDDEIATMGTANFDYRSFYQNFEINIVLFGKDVEKYRNIFLKDVEKCIEVSKKEYGQRKNIEKIKESLCRLFAPIL